MKTLQVQRLPDLTGIPLNAACCRRRGHECFLARFITLVVRVKMEPCVEARSGRRAIGLPGFLHVRCI